jgi:hypothetical protein
VSGELDPALARFASDKRSPLAKALGDLATRPMKVCEVPGVPGLVVGIWALTQSEADKAKIAAFGYVRGTLKMSEVDLAYSPGAFDDNLAIEVLALALRDPHAPERPFARDGQELRDGFDPITLGRLHALYVGFVDERHRPPEDLEREVDELIELAKKGQDASARWRSLAGPSLPRLLPILADRLARLTHAPSSPLSPPSDSAPTSTG